MARKLANNYMTDLRNNREFLDSAYLNNATFNMYMQIFEDVARSMFEWVRTTRQYGRPLVRVLIIL